MIRMAVLIFFGVLACPAQAVLHSTDFMAQLRQAAQDASSAVPPLRMPERKPPRVLTGKFAGDTIDSLVITENGTAFCKGLKPEPRNCQPINGLSSTVRAIPVTDEKGRTVLLQFEGLKMSQVCSINAAGFRVSLDCRALDARKFTEYRGQSTADGKALIVDSIEGKVLCTEVTGTPHCMRITEKDGRPVERVQRVAPTFALKPVVLNYEDDFDDNRLAAYENFMYGEIGRDCWGGCGYESWWIDRSLPLYPPGPDRDRCLTLCQQDADTMNAICAVGAGVACVAAGPHCVEAGGAVGLICLGAAGMRSVNCRANCMR